MNSGFNFLNDILIPEIRLTVDANNGAVFQELLAYGFKLHVQPGASLFDLLCYQVGIREIYLNDRVQTIFLNGQAVDDLRDEFVKDRSVIALSAAMPGLAGAVFRKNAILSPMRTIPRSKPKPTPGQTHLTASSGYVTLKLFNLIASDLGVTFFKQGILINADHFIRFVKRRLARLQSVCRSLTINGKQCKVEELFSVCRTEGDVRLFITFM